MVDNGNGTGHLFAFSQSKKERSMFKSICNDRVKRERGRKWEIVCQLTYTPSLNEDKRKEKLYIENYILKLDLNMSIILLHTLTLMYLD